LLNGRVAGWPTPCAQDDNKSVEAHLAMKQRMGERDGTNANRTAITSLQVMVQTVAGWPTPTEGDADSSGSRSLPSSKAHPGLSLTDAALMTGWATPHASDHRPGHASRMMGTPRVNLNDQSMLATGWATPAARDYRTPNHQTYVDRGGGPKGEQLNNQVAHCIPGASLSGSRAGTGSLGLLNPAFSLWLIGAPATWLDCAPSATRSTSASRNKSSAHGA
jgi:hypothetical protein